LWLVALSVVTQGTIDYAFYIPYALVAFPIGGFFFGIVMWHFFHWFPRFVRQFFIKTHSRLTMHLTSRFIVPVTALAAATAAPDTWRWSA
jgi:hypothetical protein